MTFWSSMKRFLNDIQMVWESVALLLHVISKDNTRLTYFMVSGQCEWSAVPGEGQLGQLVRIRFAFLP